MTSQRVERTWIRTGSYGRFRGEWVKGNPRSNSWSRKKKSKRDYKQIELTHRTCDYKKRSSYPRELVTRIASGHNHSGLGIPVSTLRAEALRSIFPDKSSFSQLRVDPTYLGRSKGLCSKGNRPVSGTLSNRAHGPYILWVFSDTGWQFFQFMFVFAGYGSIFQTAP